MAANIFTGKWVSVLESVTNFDAMMTAMEITDPTMIEMFRKKTWLDFSVDGDNWTIKVTTDGVPDVTDYKFKLDKWQDFSGFDGQDYRGHLSVEGNVMTEIINPKNGTPGLTIIRTVNGNEMECKQTIKPTDGKEVEMVFKMKRE